MGVTNLGRVQGGGFYYADYTPSDAENSMRLGRELLKPNTVKALIGDHVVMADGSLWEITEFSEGELGVVLVLSRKTSIIGPQGPVRIPEIGEIYMSTNPTSPASIFGGTWERIKDRFLLGSGDSYGAGATGGSASVTLTGDNLPNILQVGQNKSGVEKWISGCVWTNQPYADQAWIITQKYYLNEVGNNYVYNQPHDNMPPYYVVNIWRRTA